MPTAWQRPLQLLAINNLIHYEFPLVLPPSTALNLTEFPHVSRRTSIGLPLWWTNQIMFRMTSWLAGTCHQPHLLKRGKTTMFQPIESTSTPGAKRAPPRGKALWSVMFCSEGNQENGDLFSIQSRYAFNVPDGAVLSLSVSVDQGSARCFAAVYRQITQPSRRNVSPRG